MNETTSSRRLTVNSWGASQSVGNQGTVPVTRLRLFGETWGGYDPRLLFQLEKMLNVRIKRNSLSSLGKSGLFCFRQEGPARFCDWCQEVAGIYFGRNWLRRFWESEGCGR
ncbi:MAG: hypothetical protein U0903_19905 [Planctomycetales bacterium]